MLGLLLLVMVGVEEIVARQEVKLLHLCGKGWLRSGLSLHNGGDDLTQGRLCLHYKKQELAGKILTLDLCHIPYSSEAVRASL